MSVEPSAHAATGLAVDLRPPSTVMRLDRMGSFFPSRLSFMPTLVRRMCAERWTVEQSRCALSPEGYGHVVYRARGPERTYSLIAFSRELSPEDRSDRVIATAWDATFALFDGEPTDADIERLSQNVPHQEAGRCSPSELVLSRANRSVRVFDHMVEALAAGRQPDAELVASVGYLMRTTAVYGNGKFGIADRAKVDDRPELAGPFQAEMLNVYLIRCFTLDLVEHIARHRAPGTFVPLDGPTRRRLGIGNSTGLGMAPFLANQPVLINNWITARETALARVRSLDAVPAAKAAAFRERLAEARAHVGEWRVDDTRQSDRIEGLATDLAAFADWLDATDPFAGPAPFDAVYRHAEAAYGLEAQELIVSLCLEPNGDLVDPLVTTMAATEGLKFEAGMTVGRLKDLIASHYRWALEIDFSAPHAQKRFWYVSEEKLEPRLGERDEEPGADREMPLAIARDVRALADLLDDFRDDQLVVEVTLARPEARYAAARVQTIARHPYGEIRDNLIDADCLPIDLLRCKLSFFGASKFDPKSDRWTRITMFAGAPLPDELTPETGDWFLLAPGSAS
ncbi:hypothetical protein [Amorphus orientalis]|uniref:Uncharacterized protein n=1 Tax=Amorphus orientalis TaxID=649198 RepID=A0AAE3VP13_9HYPH|nr:hypothetical protein [Amorphus orientalis]MDQ0315593.1 hypothetical protein [Amorphus orientalis]